MGIQGLTRLISDHAPGSMKTDGKVENYFGRKIAIDASMAIYQFLIAVRQAGGEGQLTNDAGEVTSHLTGMFYRTIKMLEAGIKPVFVFDGKPPKLKGGQLAKRKERKEAAEAELSKLQKEGGAAEDIERQQKRLVRASREQSEEVKKLLVLMGVPVVDAPCEAEATCAALAKAGLVYATGTEDMDALTFGTPVLVRHLNESESKKKPIFEFNVQKVLEELQLTMAQFIDMCILCGCDYVDSIKGVGPQTALKLIREHGDMEHVIAHLTAKGTVMPEPFPFEEARGLFVNPDVIDTSSVELKWGECDVEGLRKYLIDEKQFAEERVTNGINRLKKTKGKASQGRMESFFGATTTVSSEKALKRKQAEQDAKAKGKGKAAAKGGAKGLASNKKAKK